jgi:hypothetical protein
MIFVNAKKPCCIWLRTRGSWVQFLPAAPLKSTLLVIQVANRVSFCLNGLPTPHIVRRIQAQSAQIEKPENQEVIA